MVRRIKMRLGSILNRKRPLRISKIISPSGKASLLFKAFVFDLDGTLVDSKIDFDSMKAELRIHSDADVLAHIETLDSADQERALDTVYRYELAGAKASVRIAGALEFVQRARSSQTPVAIFTRNARTLADDCLRAHGFEVDLVVAREDAPAKPKPDGLFKIAKALSVKVGEILFVGDYVYDLQAGLAAGASTALYLPNPPDFSIEGAAFTFTSYEQLSDRLWSK